MQPVTKAGTTKVQFVLNRPKLDELRKVHEIKTEAELAKRIGISAETLWRASNGTPPSNAFMARLKLAFPNASLDSLFTLREAP